MTRFICSCEHSSYNSLCIFNRTEEIVMPAERSGKIKENYEWKVRQSIATCLLAMLTVKSNGIELEQVVHSRRTSCYRSGWTRGFGEPNTNPQSWIFVSISVGLSPLSFLFNRGLKIRGRRRHRKRRWKSEFAFFRSSSRLLQVTNFIKCRWTLLKLNS